MESRERHPEIPPIAIPPPDLDAPWHAGWSAARVLLAEADAEARDGLRRMIAGTPELSLVCESESAGALRSLETGYPEIVVLAVELLETEVGGWLARRDPRTAPLLILTAPDDGARARWALEAFELGALDFLRRPVDLRRAAAALGRAREEVGQRRTRDEVGQLVALALRPPTARPPGRITLRTGGRLIVLDVAEVESIEAAANYVRLHHEGRGHFLRETMDGIEARLCPDRFVRVHRCALVNVDRIRELVRDRSGEWTVVLASGRRLPISRRYREALYATLASIGEGGPEEPDRAPRDMPI